MQLEHVRRYVLIGIKCTLPMKTKSTRSLERVYDNVYDSDASPAALCRSPRSALALTFRRGVEHDDDGGDAIAAPPEEALALRVDGAVGGAHVAAVQVAVVRLPLVVPQHVHALLRRHRQPCEDVSKQSHKPGPRQSAFTAPRPRAARPPSEHITAELGDLLLESYSRELLDRVTRELLDRVTRELLESYNGYSRVAGAHR
eukprot:4376-Prorocentrum_minimum.AAC.2